MYLEKNYDVIVVGAGPGGSTTASYLGRAGIKTLLLDKAKFPRDKTCGDALSGKSMSVIRELGLLKEIEKHPHARIDGVIFSSPSGESIEIPFSKKDPNRDEGRGYCMKRIHTDDIFFNTAKKTKNVVVKEKIQITNVIMQNGYAVGVEGIDLSSNARPTVQYNAKIIVGADSVNSAVAKSVLGECAQLHPKHSCDAVRGYYSGITGLSGKIEIHFFDSVQPGYFWIFPLENNTANVGLGMLSSDLQKIMKNKNKNQIHLLKDAIKNEKIIKDRFKDAKLIGQLSGWRLPFGSHKRQVAGDGWVLVGDAASLVDPFSGEGVGNATLSAKLASEQIKIALEKNDFSINCLGVYQKRLREKLGPELDTSYKMQRLGKIKFLLNMVVKKARTSKTVSELISASLSNEKTKKSFENPLFYLKILFC